MVFCNKVTRCIQWFNWSQVKHILRNRFPSSKMSKGRLNEDDLLDTIAKSNEVSSSDKVLYLVNGVLVSLCPICMYTPLFAYSRL